MATVKQRLASEGRFRRLRVGRAFRVALVVTASATILGLFGAAAGEGRSASAPTGKVLYVDRAFEIRTSDPARALEPTAAIVDRAVFDTLFTYRRGDLTHPVPLLVTTWSASPDAKTFVFRLRHDAHFADGTPLTSADVVFSLRRVINLKDSPSFLLSGVSVAAQGKFAVVLRSSKPYAALPSILANTSMGIVNSQLVRKHGGSDGVNAAETDRAQSWFDSRASAGAGSGPYVLQRFTLKTPIVLVRNPRFWGADRPAFAKVVLRNMLPPRQLLAIRRGAHQVALDLTSSQAQTLRHDRRLNVRELPSTWLFWLYANNNPQVSSITPNSHFRAAVRSALDYKALTALGGRGAVQAAGIVPSMFLGALSPKAAVRQDRAKARSELAASGVGSRRLTLEYPTDLTLGGVSFAAMAQSVQASLQAIGLHVSLAGSAMNTWLQRYREGKIALGLAFWQPDFPDPSDSLAFMPGNAVGLRAGWAKGSDPAVEQLAERATVTTAFAQRRRLFQRLQIQVNASGPFFPLLQPGHGFAATTDLKNAVFNPQYEIDVTQVSPR